MMPHKHASTQCHNQQVLAKPHHQPSNRDQQARKNLQQKVKIKSRVYIQLGEEALQIVHRTFQPASSSGVSLSDKWSLCTLVFCTFFFAMGAQTKGLKCIL